MKPTAVKCKLCLREAELRDSHIIPEFFYKPLYDSLHRIVGLSTDEDTSNVILQKGLREKLLCSECETLLSKYEMYAHEVLYDRNPIAEEGRRLFTVESVDYEKFKLFQMSVLWRAGISLLPEFEEIQLGFHEERMRRMLISSDAGQPHEYGTLLTMPILQGKRVTSLITSPDAARGDGHRVYRFVMGGCTWVFFVSSHTRDFKYGKYFLNREGRLHILAMDINDMRMLTQSFAKLKTTGKLSQALAFHENAKPRSRNESFD